jgi:hypothetical protein
MLSLQVKTEIQLLQVIHPRSIYYFFLGDGIKFEDGREWGMKGHRVAGG